MVMSGNASLLEDQLGEDNPRLVNVFRAVKRDAELTQRLLAFSRKQVLHPKVINANNLIADITGLLRRTLEEHIDIETIAAAGLWNCKVDPIQLENALVNFAVNARDAMPDGGKLTIETMNARLDDDYAAAQAEVKPGQYVMLAVTDNGTGMPPEVMEKVFDPFFTTKETGKGSGLGLSMVYGFVKHSGGHISVYSDEGEGTTFKIYLPRIVAKEEPIERPVPSVDFSARGETILVVEDDADVRTVIVAILREMDYGVLEAENGKDAIALLRKESRIDLLITDIVLPGGMGGKEIANLASEIRPGIKILFISGYTQT